MSKYFLTSLFFFTTLIISCESDDNKRKNTKHFESQNIESPDTSNFTEKDCDFPLNNYQYNHDFIYNPKHFCEDEKLLEAYQKLKLSYKDDSEFDPRNITRDLKLQENIMGASITWWSSNENIINEKGQVIRPFYKETNQVSLHAHISSGFNERTKVFKLSVVPKNPTDEDMNEIIKKLKDYNFPLYDMIALEEIQSFEELKESLRSLSRETTPDNLCNDLIKSYKHMKKWNDNEEKYHKDIESLEHVEEKIIKEVKYLNFVDLWSNLMNSENFNANFYSSFYQQLSPFLSDVEFPDDGDRNLNNNNEAKQDSLIIFLARIKNQMFDDLSIDGYSILNSDNISPYQTTGNSDLWFAECRYKLYKIYEKLDSLSDNEKKTLLSGFLHAGRHCSDAKKAQIEDNFNLFNFEAKQSLENLQEDLASDLEERMELFATKEKHQILENKINALYQVASNPQRTDDDARAIRRREAENIVVGEFILQQEAEEHSAQDIQQEGITFKASTWDLHAPNLGLKKKETHFTNFFLNFDPSDLFQSGAYTPSRLLECIRRNLHQEILDEYFGIIQHLMTADNQDKALKAVLVEKDFLR